MTLALALRQFAFVQSLVDPGVIGRVLDGIFYPLGSTYLRVDVLAGEWTKAEHKETEKVLSLSTLFADWLREAKAEETGLTLGDMLGDIGGKPERRWTLRDLL